MKYVFHLWCPTWLWERKKVEIVQTSIHSHDFTPHPCKPVVLDTHASMFGLHHLGCVVTLCLLVGCLVVIACFKMKDGANLHSFPYSNCMFCFNLRGNQWCWTNTCWCLGCTTWVALSQFVYCQVVWLQLPAWSMAVRWSEPSSIPIF